jgi:aspartate kinase
VCSSDLFTVAKKDLKEAEKIVKDTAKAVDAKKVEVDDQVSKVSIIGVGMASHSGVASKMFSTLADEGINIMMISTSEIKISCIIQRKYTELAVMVLHDAFGLEKNHPDLK